MARILYELAGADPALRLSPFCWRTRLAIAHKGLDVETVPWRFTDREAIAFSGQGRVPILVDDTDVVSDSFLIALYLEETYPERPSLFGGAGGIPTTRFVNAFDAVILPRIAHTTRGRWRGRFVAAQVPDEGFGPSKLMRIN